MLKLLDEPCMICCGMVNSLHSEDDVDDYVHEYDDQNDADNRPYG